MLQQWRIIIDTYIDPFTWLQNRFSKSESSGTLDPKFSTFDMKSFYHMPQQRRKHFNMDKSTKN